MKIKSFTLVEVMVASYVFMVVMVMVVASYALIKKSNESSDDIRITSTCSRQVEEIFRSAIKAANFGKPLIMGIDFDAGSNKYRLRDPSLASSLAGFATFEDPGVSDQSQFKIKTFVKKNATETIPQNAYYYSTGIADLSSTVPPDPAADPRVLIKDLFDVTSIVNSADSQKINSTDCSALQLASTKIKLLSVGGFGGRESTLSYLLKIQDKFYRNFADQLTEKRYSEVNIMVSNDAKTF